MSSSNNIPSTAEIINLINDLEQKLTQTGEDLIKADAFHKSTIRNGLLTGDTSRNANTRAAAEAAKIEHEYATAALTQARELLILAEKRDRDEEVQKAVAAVRALLADMETMGREADLAFATYLGAVERMRSTEKRARHIISTQLRAPLPLGLTIPDGLNEAATFIKTVRSDTAKGLTPIMEPRAVLTVTRLTNALGAAS